MCVGDALRELAGFLDGCEDEGHVTGVGLVERQDRGGSRELSAEVELTLNPSGAGERGFGLREASVDGDGRLGLTFESLDAVVPVPRGRVDVEPTGARFGTDGTVTVTLTATVPTGEEATTDGGPTAEEGRTDGERRGDRDDLDDAPGLPSGTEREREVPPFRDPELLAEVYESCDTFAEMTDAIGMDVTAETVRRYMIDYGIHQPNTYDTGDPEEDEEEAADETDETDADTGTETGDEETPGPAVDEDGSPVVLADGIGLPDDVTVETLIETVRSSRTLYEVERDIGVDREDALDMLRELNLLDLVVGRLATQGRRDIGREDVVERLREASATAAGARG
jgi:hypothetical protein